MRTTIEMAREAGLRDCTCNGTKGCLERFTEIVRADERARMAEQPAQQALDKMAENARELGLDYEPAQQEPIDQLIHAWQAIEETSGHVLDEGDVEGRMHMSVISSAWEQMDSLVREIWDERGRP